MKRGPLPQSSAHAAIRAVVPRSGCPTLRRARPSQRSHQPMAASSLSVREETDEALSLAGWGNLESVWRFSSFVVKAASSDGVADGD